LIRKVPSAPTFVKRLTPSYWPPRGASLSLIGLLGTLLLHGLLALPFILDLSLGAPSVPNHSGGANASVLGSDKDAVMTAIFINETAVRETEAPESPDLGSPTPNLAVVVFTPDSLPPVKIALQGGEVRENSATRDATENDAAQHALLYGRYLGQIQARIERAWMRPRDEIGAPRFSCQVRIEQDRQGAVVAIKLDSCNGGQRWQNSLIGAIRTASPLPAPPDPSAYADRLWLAFGSDGLNPGASPQGFEPENPETLLAAKQAQSRGSFERFSNQPNGYFRSGSNEASGTVHLTIIGTPNATTPAPAASPSDSEWAAPSEPIRPSPAPSER
jgi:hypothetical protein